MAVGSSSREVFLSMPVEKAFTLAVRAAERCGKVLDQQPATSSLTLRTRYGLQSVKLRISLLPKEGGTALQIAGAGDDVWGGGARKGSDKFVQALNEAAG